jgi:hypothetical protein
MEGIFSKASTHLDSPQDPFHKLSVGFPEVLQDVVLPQIAGDLSDETAELVRCLFTSARLTFVWPLNRKGGIPVCSCRQRFWLQPR